MIKSSTKQKLALASAITLAFISVPAQSADGTLVISGQVNANTCKVNISDGSGVSPTNNGVRSVELGTVAPPTGTITPNTLFGNQQVSTFTLTGAAGAGTTCTFASGTSWNIVLDLQASQVGTAGNSSFLTNSATTKPALNVGVALSQSGGTRLSTLATDAGYQGTKISTNNALAGGGLQLIAQFVTTSASAPTAGLFSATVPLLVVYQ